MQQSEEVVYLYLDDIIPNRFQPREVFDERPLKELAISIKEHGVIQPIIVRRVNDKYEIIAGERRYKASALAGLTKIPAIIRDLDDKETSKVALLENLQRKNLNPLEEAKTYQKILEIDQMTQEELAKTMGKSQSAVSNKLRLLSLTEEVQQALLKEEISERHARALLNVENTEEQKELLQQVIDNKMTVRQLESKIKGENQFENNVSIEKNGSSISEKKDINPNFLSTSPLMPNFGNEENKDQDGDDIPLLFSSARNNDNLESEPLIMNTNPLLVQEQNKDEPLITMSTNQNSLENMPKENNKYINFGEIDEDDESDGEKFYEDIKKDDSNILFSQDLSSSNSSIDLDSLKQNTQDINIQDNNKSNADLDSLLRINQNDFKIDNSEVELNNSSFKFFSPAAEALKESETKEIPSSSEDYFKAPDLTSIDLPGEVQTYNTNNVPLSNELNRVSTNNYSNEMVSLNDAVKIINEALEKIKASGLKVEKDEMNLEKSYQVIIKLEKQD